MYLDMWRYKCTFACMSCSSRRCYLLTSTCKIHCMQCTFLYFHACTLNQLPFFPWQPGLRLPGRGYAHIWGVQIRDDWVYNKYQSQNSYMATTKTMCFWLTHWLGLYFKEWGNFLVCNWNYMLESSWCNQEYACNQDYACGRMELHGNTIIHTWPRSFWEHC